MPNSQIDAGAHTVLKMPPATASAGMGGMPQMQSTPNTSITREPLMIDDCGATNPAGLSPDDAQKLKAGSGSPGTIKWLYPYDGTVFPRGMLAPDLMWDGAGDFVFVHIKSKIFEYSACLKPAAPGRIAVPQDVWDNAGQRSFGRDDNYVIELSTMTRGVVVGPATTHIQIAQAAIKGSIYYNTYRSNLVMPAAMMDPNTGGFPGLGIPGAGAGSNGIIVRIPPGGRAEPFGQTSDCSGCHSVSADGSRLMAQSFTSGALSYELMSNGASAMPNAAGMAGAWVALYPDGSAALSMSSAVDVARAGIGRVADATVIDAKTGETIMSNGIPPGALMPFFSPDGTYLVFNDYALHEAHGIALTRYDTKTHTASEYTPLFTEPAGAMRPAWPFLLPDNHGVVFIRTDDGDFTGNGVGVSGEIQMGAAAPFAELSIIDVSSKTVTLLAKAMGYDTPEDATAGKTYLPFGPEDLHHAYYPTVSPVGAGGYFWLFFDSIRHYGGTGVQRQLWGAALDISADGTYTRDPSHPAFYVSGQEFGTGNHRAFAALDPCRKDGDKCTSGVDCCGGFCYFEGQPELVDPVGTCEPTKHMMMCSRRDERCSVYSDCCTTDPTEPQLMCIAGFCTQVRGPD
ncbi:MAG TPA: hypothetical protein VFN67_00250 [Polyangiales bacterium]|nr:hypothetical protein [Polyangiales bacterium]